ncbi:hypothetical protein B0T18DRAFT_481258 [Schizothecium vesticola]|uniref:FAD-binding PCMH-type domain-containing protein n=1 Tax=Schizothecium vesticola TaxID=314040 RepID=A0AA40K213_9PEZI|nr:hypothetical protein B0T18DRAFT_481258 [Schizothecium vesticola]
MSPLLLLTTLATLATLALGAITSPRDITPLSTCLTTSSIPFLLPSSPNPTAWTLHATTFNARLPFVPLAVVLPTTTAQISAAVLCASSLNIPVQAKSGGHSYASFSSGGDVLSQTLVVDLENFQDVVVNNTTYVASVGGGVRLGNLALGIYAQGERALAHGTCPGVGIGGHFTHGGYGYSSRAYGLALEQIVGVEVVLASGEVVTATKEKYKDIYWAVRGAADSFGIVTTFYLQTVPAPSVVQFSYDVSDALASSALATSAFLAVQSFALNASVVTRELGLGVTITASSFAVHGTYFGSIQTFNATVAPALLNALKQAGAKVAMNKSSVQELTWIESLTRLGGAPTLAVPLTGYDSRDNFFAKSVSVSNPFGEKPVKAYFDVVVREGERAPVDWFAIINLYGGPDSQIGVRNESFAAYAGFDDLWVVQNYGSVTLNETFPKSGMAFVNKLNDAMTNNLPEYSAYLNYIDPTYTREQAYKLYFGAGLVERLSKLKAVLDPKNVFRNPQSIW